MLVKKGDPVDVIIVVVLLFIFAIFFLVYFYFTTVTADALEQTPINNSDTAAGIEGLRDLGEQGAANGFMMIFGALILGVIITSFLVRVHPVFLFLYIIMLLVTNTTAVLLGNGYAAITAQEPFLSLAAQQPAIDYIMTHIVRIALGVSALSMVVVFAKVFGPDNSP